MQVILRPFKYRTALTQLAIQILLLPIQIIQVDIPTLLNLVSSLPPFHPSYIPPPLPDPPLPPNNTSSRFSSSFLVT